MGMIVVGQTLVVEVMKTFAEVEVERTRESAYPSNPAKQTQAK
jgi:hypothetical protein